jgi:L-alanine-DL-glutamate epimerase-like enolase superfamily enzyme
MTGDNDVRSTDVTIRNVSIDYEEYRYRTPIKFGGVALDRVTILNVWMDVEGTDGKTARGFGSMPLGNVWAWPTRALTYDQTLLTMQRFASATAGIYGRCKLAGHPIEITHTLEPELLACNLPGLTEPMPALAKLVVASAFDAALHDAFGKLLGLNCWHTYGPEFLEHDLGHYLGADFKGETLDRFITTEPKPRMPLYHLVGALDPITPAEVTKPVGDGLPEHLAEWIHRDGLTHLKVKLNGDDLKWDVDRLVGVHRVAEQVQRHRGVAEWWYSLDFNERCKDVSYLNDFILLASIGMSQKGFDRVQYIEQPTARDLKAHPDNKMHVIAKLKPVVIDESLIDLESLYLSREMGYTGVAFKACKGQTQTLLLAAAAQKLGLFRCVQDLSCPGASLIQSASIAAHIPGVAAIESNSRQYCPVANAPWEAKFPGVFTIHDGTINTAILNGPGLGAV